MLRVEAAVEREPHEQRAYVLDRVLALISARERGEAFAVAGGAAHVRCQHREPELVDDVLDPGIEGRPKSRVRPVVQHDEHGMRPGARRLINVKRKLARLTVQPIEGGKLREARQHELRPVRAAPPRSRSRRRPGWRRCRARRRRVADWPRPSRRADACPRDRSSRSRPRPAPAIAAARDPGELADR